MKKLFFAGLVCLAISLYSCNSNTTTESDTDSLNVTSPAHDSLGMNRTDTGTVSNWTDSDKDFAQEASRGGLLEVAAGNLAKERGTSQAVKDFGARMVTDHTKANEELASLLKSKNVVVDVSYDKDQQKELDKLADLSGKDFDKEYIDAMVKDHKDDVDAFKKASEKADDPDLRSWAAKTLPTLESHLAEVKKIKDGMK